MHGKLSRLKELSQAEKSVENRRNEIEMAEQKLSDRFIGICQARYQISPHNVSTLSDEEVLLLYNETIKNIDGNSRKLKMLNYLELLGSISVITIVAGIIIISINNFSLIGVGTLIVGVSFFFFGLSHVTKLEKLQGENHLLLVHEELEKLGYWKDSPDEKLLKLLKPARKP